MTIRAGDLPAEVVAQLKAELGDDWRRATQPRTKRQRPEGETVSAVIDYLTARGVFCWRSNTGAYRTPEGRYIRFGLPGSSDILGVTADGKFIAAEVKTETGKLTDLQADFLRRVNERGGIGLVCRPGDYSDVIDAALTAISRGAD